MCRAVFGYIACMKTLMELKELRDKSIGGVMVSTSARNAGGPWFDSRSRHDRFLYANSVCLYNFLYRAVLCFLYTYSRCSRASVNLTK